MANTSLDAIYMQNSVTVCIWLMKKDMMTENWSFHLDCGRFLFKRLQAEYMFSEMSMLANESFSKHVYKDPEGYGEDSIRLNLET